MKSMTRTVPVSVCVACALITVGCDRTDAPSTSVKQANQQTPVVETPATPAPNVAAAVPVKPAADTIKKKDPAVVDLKLTDGSEQTPPNASAPVFTTAVIKAEPVELDLGEIATNDSKTGKVKLVNSSDTSIKILRAQASCGCTTMKFVPNTMLAAHESMDVEVQLSGGAKAGPISGKTVTFIVENHPDIIVPLRANAISFVVAEPATLDPETMPEGQLTLKSADGQPFRVMSVVPQVVTNLDKEARSEHTITVSWDEYRRIGISRQMIVYLDHPKCQQVYVNVNFSAQEMQKRAEEQQKQHLNNQDAIKNAATQPQPAPIKIDPDVELASMVKAGENVEILKRLQSGLDVNYRDASGASLLSIAAKEGNVELVRALLQIANIDAASADNVGRTALMHGATSKNAEVVRVLLDASANPSTRDNLGNTALSWAAWLGDADSVRELIDAGSDVEVVSAITGWTPLILASGFGDPSAVEALLKARAEINTADILEGATPLIHAARTGHVESIKVLVKNGVEMESVDRNGNTAFLACAKYSGGDAVKLKALIDSGANVKAKDHRGLNALQLARKRTDGRAAEIITMLEPILGAETPAESNE